MLALIALIIAVAAVAAVVYLQKTHNARLLAIESKIATDAKVVTQKAVTEVKAGVSAVTGAVKKL